MIDWSQIGTTGKSWVLPCYCTSQLENIVSGKRLSPRCCYSWRAFNGSMQTLWLMATYLLLLSPRMKHYLRQLKYLFLQARHQQVCGEECCVCLEYHTNPIALPCGHVLCAECCGQIQDVTTHKIHNVTQSCQRVLLRNSMSPLSTPEPLHRARSDVHGRKVLL